MDWISVKDRMPEKDEGVLVYGKADKCCGSCVMLGEARYSHEREQFSYGEWDCVCEATHWMPLPEPPKEEINHGLD